MKNLKKDTHHELSKQPSIMSYKREMENFTMRGEGSEVTEARHYTAAFEDGKGPKSRGMQKMLFLDLEKTKQQITLKKS